MTAKTILRSFRPSSIWIGITPLLIFIVISCASASEILVPTLPDRTLYLDPTAPRFFYNHMECEKKGLFGNCKAWKKVTDYYDLNDPVMRQRLIDMGFEFSVPKKHTP